MFAKRKNRIVILCIALGMAVAAMLTQRASAHPSPDAAPIKMGAINLQWAVLATDEGKKETEAMRQQFAPQSADLKSLEDEITKMQKDARDKATTMTPSERTERTRAIEAKEREYNRHKEEALNELQTAERQLFGQLSGKMMKVVQDYSKANGYTVVLDAGSPESPILFATERINISQQLVEAYNKAYPVKSSGSGSGSTK